MGERAPRPTTQIPVPVPKGTSAITPVGPAPHVGVPPPLGVPGVGQEVPITIGEDDGGPGATGRRDKAMVALAFEGLILEGRMGG